MACKSSIEWTEYSWNPITGCTKISPGCKNCYAERMANRLQAIGQPKYVNGFRLTLHKNELAIPLKWKHPRIIFVNSMSDLLHKDVPDEFILKIFSIMSRTPHHRFQLLTKRSHRLMQISPKLPWHENIWMGVTVENADYTFRINQLRKTPAKVKFISFEPLLGPVSNLDLRGIDWVIVGGESGPNARLMDAAWVTEIKEQCQNSGVPFFFKQWGGKNRKKSGRKLEGRTWDEMPLLSLMNASY